MTGGVCILEGFYLIVEDSDFLFDEIFFEIACGNVCTPAVFEEKPVFKFTLQIVSSIDETIDERDGSAGKINAEVSGRTGGIDPFWKAKEEKGEEDES